MDKNREQWTIRGEDKIYIIDMVYDGDYATVLVNDKVIDKIKIKHFFNYEYTFEVDGYKCSIVKLVTDKSMGFVVNGVYQNKSRSYSPVTNIPVLTWIAFLLNFAYVILSAIFIFKPDIELTHQMSLLLMTIVFVSAVIYCIRVVCNAPCSIRDSKKNLLLRSSLIAIIEIISLVIGISFIKFLV